MNQKEFNSLLNNISDKLNPLNQLLYQAFILIVFYYIFDTITHLQTHKQDRLILKETDIGPLADKMGKKFRIG